MSSIVAAIITTTSVGVQDWPSEGPQTGPCNKDIETFGNPTFAKVASARGPIQYLGIVRLVYGSVSRGSCLLTYGSALNATSAGTGGTPGPDPGLW